jgi:tuberculosinol/isotuberculosinol synthase
MELDEFLQLPSEKVAEMMRAGGPKVCAFPINGTRRWFTLEYGGQKWDDPVTAYMDIAGRNHIGLYRLFFDHGIDTLLTPIFGLDLLSRGDEYVRRVGMGGLKRLVEHPTFLDFYDEYNVRVHIYGDHRRHLAGTGLAHLSDLFDEVAERTRHHDRFRLFFGVFAHDATQAVAEYSVGFYQEHGRVPEKRELIEMYYGESVEPVDLFIGFDRFSVFDMPLLATGEEDLYFTISPSPYMNERQLRGILYDHMVTRRCPEPDYVDLSPRELQDLRNYYASHHGYTLGTGRLLHGIWTPNTCE